MMLELRCECSHMRYWMHEHLGLSILREEFQLLSRCHEYYNLHC